MSEAERRHNELIDKYGLNVPVNMLGIHMNLNLIRIEGQLRGIGWVLAIWFLIWLFDIKPWLLSLING